MLYDKLKSVGYHPAILMRGYRGTATKPMWVDTNLNRKNLFGDEAVMISGGRNVMVARDRSSGADAIAESGKYDLIIMDDGLQNPNIFKDFKIVMFDGSVGVGNGWLIPAGPLRVPFKNGVKKVDAFVINGTDQTGIQDRLPKEIPVYFGQLQPDQNSIEYLKTKPVLAFAGIGQPTNFFSTLRKAGIKVKLELAFADHHPYREADLVRIQRMPPGLVSTL